VRNTADGPPRPGGLIGAGDLVARYRPAIAAGYTLLLITVLVITDRFDRPTVLAAVLGGTVVVAWRNPRPWARFVMDWMPLFVILVSYDLIRAQADSLIPRAHLEPQRSIDEFIGGGTAPSVRLQAEYFRPDHLHWYDYALFVVYLTHFAAAIVVGVVLYLMNRERFRRFAKIFLAFSLAGYLTYVIYPAIPPWLASKQGALPHTARAVHTIWDHLGLEFMEKVFSGNPRYSNPVGALPSEHGAYPLLFLLLFWAFATRGWRIALVLYTLVMAFALVYLAEHYVTDILLGWIYAALAFIVVGRILDRREARREQPALTVQPIASQA
jgi:membrane-associated phospholipid phosphatase